MHNVKVSQIQDYHYESETIRALRDDKSLVNQISKKNELDEELSSGLKECVGR